MNHIATRGESRLSRILSYTAFLTLIAGTPAFAHVTAHPAAGEANNFFETKFQVPHGCDGAATIAVRIKIPDGVTTVKAQMKPGWNVSIKMRKLDPPMKGEGGQTLTETVDEVDWQGGPLPDNLYEEFGLVMKLPATAGQTLYFPVVQECQPGVHRWINIPAACQKWNEVREPAPFVLVTQPR
jgi:periplasmic copper chaperone A